MTMGLEPKWTDISDMLATCTDDQLLKWKEIAENPSGDNFKFITSLRQVVVHMYNKRAKDIINELSIAVNDELNFRNRGIKMDKKLEARIARLEKLLNIKNESNDSNLEYISDDIERGLRRELGVNSWNISAKPVFNKRYNDNYVEVTIEGNGDVPSECVGIFKVYRRGFWYRITVDDNKNRHIGSFDSLDEVVSMISDIMTVKGENFYE